MKHFIILIILFFFSGVLSSQSTYIVVDSILISGNSKTKNYIVFNELDFKVGDTIFLDKLAQRFQVNKDRILGTGLFVDATFNIKEIITKTSKSTIVLQLKESWYIFPKLIFDLADRNFNEWYYDQNASLKRVNFGMEFSHYNTSGNKDPLEIKLQGGITKKVELKYIRPYLTKKHRLGFVFNILYKYSKELSYNTVNNKLVKIRSEEKNLFKQFRVLTGITYRPAVFDYHAMNLQFFNNSIDSLILRDYNPDFFSNKSEQKYFDISYSFVRDKRKYKLYPKGGYLWGFTVEKLGIGIFKDINQLFVYPKFEKYFLINKNYISSYQFSAKKRLFGDKTPYFNNISLGYEEDFLNGYELYVIDGRDFVYMKTSQRLRFLSGMMNLKKWIPIKQFKYIPYDFYLSINYDMGYVNNNVNFALNDFTNRVLYGYGLGLDMIFYNTFVRLSYSFNHVGDSGFFLKFTSGL